MNRFVHQEVKVAWDNFRVNAGTISCDTPWWEDDSPTGTRCPERASCHRLSRPMPTGRSRGRGHKCRLGYGSQLPGGGSGLATAAQKSELAARLRLDVSVQAAVLDMFSELRRELGLAVLFISHDLGVVASVADRVLVLDRGAVCEQGRVADVLTRPQEPYTRRLLESAPRLDARAEAS